MDDSFLQSITKRVTPLTESHAGRLARRTASILEHIVEAVRTTEEWSLHYPSPFVDWLPHSLLPPDTWVEPICGQCLSNRPRTLRYSSTDFTTLRSLDAGSSFDVGPARGGDGQVGEAFAWLFYSLVIAAIRARTLATSAVLLVPVASAMPMQADFEGATSSSRESRSTFVSIAQSSRRTSSSLCETLPVAPANGALSGDCSVPTVSGDACGFECAELCAQASTREETQGHTC